jgi:hypothetical protein
MIVTPEPSLAGMQTRTLRLDDNPRIGATLDAVRLQVARIAALVPTPRPERLSGIHNPWGLAATLAHAWSFLDLCEDASVVNCVAGLIGDDVVLWDSALHLCATDYLAFAAAGREGRYWPVEPLAGAVAVISFAAHAELRIADVLHLVPQWLAGIDGAAPVYVMRYMPATSRFVRDPRLPVNWTAMEEQPLINYAKCPLWLVRGEDRAGNDFVTGFATSAPSWAAP